MTVKRWIVPLIVIACLFGSVLVGRATGTWQTSGARLTDLSGAKVEDIKGSSTLGDVSAAFGIPLPELRTLLGIPSDTPPETKMKDLEQYNEVDVVRNKVGVRLGVATPFPTSVATKPAPVATPQPASGPQPTLLPASQIKGSMTLKEVSEQCGIPLEVLYKELKLGSNVPATTALKDLGTVAPGLETTQVRDVVAAYQAKK